MTYFIWACFFVGGWVLSKFDSQLQINKISQQAVESMERVAKAAFTKGIQYGSTETIKLYGGQPPSVPAETDDNNSSPMGFAIPKGTKQ